MKTYRGYNQGGDTSTEHLVTVTEDDQAEAMLEHHVKHSPTGLSWGYGGSGPADLARSILWDHLWTEPHPACYQAFKFAFVAGWPADGNWEITSDQIEQWRMGYIALGGGPVTVAEVISPTYDPGDM